MTDYAKHITSPTPQTEQADQRQVKNDAGGYTFKIEPFQQLDRWLILGGDGGTYYTTERALTIDNARCIQACLKLDGQRVVRRIVEISDAGRAPKNDPAIFALAIAASCDDPKVRDAALRALPQVCRIGTHLFQFVKAVNALRGWGPALKAAVRHWYSSKSDDQVAVQIAKYGQRDGVSHRDLLRLSHPKADKDPQRNAIYRYVTKEGKEIPEGLLEYLVAFEELKKADERRTIQLINQWGFTHEMVLTEHKNSPHVWAALLEKMPITALIRNLGKMTEVGVLKPLTGELNVAIGKLTDLATLRKGRVHPITILTALKTYEQGHGDKGSLKWTPVPALVGALDEAFYKSFGTIEPSGLRTLIALDVSGSMDGSKIAGSPLSAREASAAMAMVTMRTEKNWHIFGFSNRFIELPLHSRMSLVEVVTKLRGLPFQSTDCSLPFIYAKQHKLEVDAFQVWTDNETYAGSGHPHERLKEYRKAMGINSTSAVIGTDARPFTIAHPDDPGMCDLVGFDTATPNLLASFARGWQ